MPVSLRHAHDTSASATAEEIPARQLARTPKSFRPPWASVKECSALSDHCWSRPEFCTSAPTVLQP
jgi:hypothetical protein